MQVLEETKDFSIYGFFKVFLDNLGIIKASAQANKEPGAHSAY